MLVLPSQEEFGTDVSGMPFGDMLRTAMCNVLKCKGEEACKALEQNMYHRVSQSSELRMVFEQTSAMVSEEDQKEFAEDLKTEHDVVKSICKTSRNVKQKGKKGTEAKNTSETYQVLFRHECVSRRCGQIFASRLPAIQRHVAGEWFGKAEARLNPVIQELGPWWPR